MDFKNMDVNGFETAIRGMRMSWNSHEKSDSFWKNPIEYQLGDNDIELMKKLIKAGPEHRKFLRAITVSVEITGDLSWWKQMDQYKVGTTTLSESTMHCLMKNPITIDSFNLTDYDENLYVETANGHTHIGIIFEEYVTRLEQIRQMYVETGDKGYFRELVRLLPESWLQTRVWCGNYEAILSIYNQRKGHKLGQWKEFRDFCESLPYFKELFMDLTNFSDEFMKKLP